MRLIYRQTMVQEIRVVIAEAVASGRQLEEMEHIELSWPEWERLEGEFGMMGLAWTEAQRIVVFGVPIRRC